MSEFRELFDKASKKSSSINNNSEARALRLVRTNLLDKYSGNMNFSFNLEQIVVFVLTKVRGSLDQAFESFPQPELIIQKIIDINKKFFFELTPENITENEISILRYLSKKRTDLFPLLFTSLFTELSCLFSSIPQFYSSLRNYLPDLYDLIGQSRELTHLFLFKTIRVIEDSDRIEADNNILKKNEKQPQNRRSIDAEYFVSYIITRINQEFLSREFLRFQYSYVLQMKNITLPEYYINNVITNSAPQSFFDSIIPSQTQELLKQNINLRIMLKECDSCLKQGFISDCIRWALNITTLDHKDRAKIVDNILKTCEIPVDTYDVMLSLSVEYLTFSRERADDEKIFLALIDIIRMFSREYSYFFLNFIEQFASTNPIFPEGIAKAQMRTNKKLRFQKLELPEIEMEAPRVDLTKELDVLTKKIKWNAKNIDFTHFIKCVTPLFKTLKFQYPFEVPEDANTILNADVKILIKLLPKIPVLYQYFILYCPQKVTEAIEIANSFLEENPQALMNCFIQLVPLAPNVVNVISEITDRLEIAVDTSDLIRVVSHQCTLEEIQIIMKKPFFSTPGECTNNLLKQSAKWHRIAQQSFWYLLSLAYDINHRKAISQGFIETATQFSSLGRTLCVQLLITSSYIPENIAFIEETISKTETWTTECIKILKLWAKFNEDGFINAFKHHRETLKILCQIPDKSIFSKKVSDFLESVH